MQTVFGLPLFAGWWILGLVLLTLEVLLPGFLLVFFGAAALVVGANAFLLEPLGWFGWASQVVSFLVLSGVAVLAGRNWYGAWRRSPASDHLNSRTAGLVGREARLSEAIVGGRGRAALDDSWWNVEGPDLPAGERVRVVSAEGSLLRVEPVPHPPEIAARGK